jgi:hypothetical protein
MAQTSGGRSYFREWVDKHEDPGWGLMPLTHITKGVGANDIGLSYSVKATDCNVFQEPLAYFFYGRPAYRVGGDGSIKREAACPFCFIFDSELIKKAKYIYPFDTGAFEKRMYQHIVVDEMNVEDFSLEQDISRPNRIISKVFLSREAYFTGDKTNMVSPEEGAEPWEMHARSYLDLIASRGRNEPDDRIHTIEVVLGADVPLTGNLRAVIVPHTMWDDTKKAPWLEKLQDLGVEIAPYEFIPGRHPEHYHALLETKVRDLYRKWGAL